MERRQKLSKAIIFFFILFLLWVVLQFLAPIFLPSSSVKDLSGMVGVSDNEKLIEKLKEKIAYQKLLQRDRQYIHMIQSMIKSMWFRPQIKYIGYLTI